MTTTIGRILEKYHHYSKLNNFKNLSALIIGYGSAGKRHARALEKLNIKNISVLSKQKINKYNVVNTLHDIKKINPDYIIVSSVTSLHLNHIKFIEKNFINKTILIEKPLFHKFVKAKFVKNKYYVGYNLRFNPCLNLLKKRIKNKKINFVNINCSSYLPHWRKKTATKRNSMSFSNHVGGGVLLELSHEIDYIKWLFGDFKILFVFNSKISNLKTKSDDILILNALSKKKIVINMTINFFSKIKRREIFIDGNDINIYGDLINNKSVVIENNITEKKSWPKFNMDKSFFLENLEALSKKKLTICKFNEATDTMKIISKIRKLR